MEKVKREKDNLLDALTNLANVVSEMQEPELDPVEQKIQNAKLEVFDEWIDNIVNYNPRKG